MAERLTLHIFKQSPESLIDFSESLRAITSLRSCAQCFHIAENDTCDICQDKQRDISLLCVVEEPMDIIALERMNSYRGRYHVLGGTLEVSPKKSSEPSSLHIDELLRRVEINNVTEVIIATNPTTEGDLTALYLSRKLQPYATKVTRLGRGLSTGGDIEYADEVTLSSALANRRELK